MTAVGNKLEYSARLTTQIIYKNPVKSPFNGRVRGWRWK
jgi:hypothetical protein